ncbi:MAG: hypothetical protein ACXITR_02740 [Cyanobacterium sp.]
MNEEKKIDQYQQISQEKEQKQNLTKTALKFATVLTAVGLSGTAWSAIAHANPSQNTIKADTTLNAQLNQPVLQRGQIREVNGTIGTDRNLLMNQSSMRLTREQWATGKLMEEAIKTGNMDQAIRQWGNEAKLSQPQLESLRKLNTDDLRTLGRIQDQLGDLGAVSDVIGAVVF